MDTTIEQGDFPLTVTERSLLLSYYESPCLGRMGKGGILPGGQQWAELLPPKLRVQTQLISPPQR